MGRASSLLHAGVRALGIAVPASLATTLLLAIATPLYTDEVGFKMQVTRVFDEGGAMVSLLPQCTQAHVLSVPVSWLPAAAIFAVLFRPLGLLGLKLSGVALAFAWFGLAWHLLGRLGRGPARKRRFALFCAAHALGVVPFTLVMARAEGAMLVCLLAIGGFAFGGWVGPRTSRRRAGLLLAGFALLVSVFFFGHPKAILSTPALLLAAWLGFARRGRGWAAAAALCVLFTAGQSFLQASRAGRCPEAPYIEKVTNLFVLSPSLAVREPRAFFRSGYEDLVKSAEAIAKDMVITPTFPSGWLPPLEPASAKLGPVVEAANAATRGGLRALELAAIVLGLAGIVATRRRGARARHASWFGAALLFCLGGHLFFTVFWPFYNTSYAVPQLAFIVSFGSIAIASRSRRLRRAAVPAGGLVLGITLFVSCTTLVHLGPRIVARAFSGSQGTLLPDQLASVPPLHYARERDAIRALAGRCGIHGDGSTGLIIDDATLYAFDDLYRPLHVLYFSDASMWGVYMPGAKNVEFIRELRAPGMITRCSFLPTLLAPKMVRDDRGYCCLGADELRTTR